MIRASEIERPFSPGAQPRSLRDDAVSVVLSCADAGGDAQSTREALAELCKIYWRPVFAFICGRGHSVTDAQDLTQDFFVMVLKGRLLECADRSRGRFRSLVLTSLQNFLHDAAEKRRARKRGGDVQFVSWDVCGDASRASYA